MADPTSDAGTDPRPVIRDRRRLDPETGQVREQYARTKAGKTTKTSNGNGMTSGTSKTTEKAAGAQSETPRVEDADQAQSDQELQAGDEHAGSDELGAAPGAEPSAERERIEQLEKELAQVQAEAEERLGDLQRLQAEYVNYRKRVERDRDVAREYAIAGVLESLLPVLDDVHLSRQHGDLEGGPFAAIAEKLESVLSRYGLSRYGEPGQEFDPAVHEALMHTEAELAEGTQVTTVVQILQPGYRVGERVLRAARVAVADPPGD
jgi:molecular chaperone GrpE